MAISRYILPSQNLESRKLGTGILLEGSDSRRRMGFGLRSSIGQPCLRAGTHRQAWAVVLLETLFIKKLDEAFLVVLGARIHQDALSASVIRIREARTAGTSPPRSPMNREKAMDPKRISGPRVKRKATSAKL
jgi:hypothetical protein